MTNTYTDRQINDMFENLSRISRQVKLIREGKTTVKDTGEDRMDIILKMKSKCQVIMSESKEALADG